MVEQIQKLTHLEHILKRPDSYVGPVSRIQEEYWVLNNDHFEKKKLTYSPALLKIFDEILVNAIDRNSLHPKNTNNITVNIIDNFIEVKNNGPLGGISVKMHDIENIWNPELTFGHLLTSTNYNDNQNRVVGGRNGYGAKLTNVYSSEFHLNIKDAENNIEYSQIWRDNMKTCEKPKMKKYNAKTSYVTIKFKPDWKLFGMNNIDDDIIKIIEKRVHDANVCTSLNCKVSFQDKQLPKYPLNVYAKMYKNTEEICSVSNENWSICVLPNDGFEQISFVNGICTTKGGSHVDYITNMICNSIIEELSKKVKLKPQQVKNCFMIFVKATLVNPSFSSQVKSECTLKVSEFGSKFELPKTFTKNILKTDIYQDLMNVAKMKEMKELKKSDGVRKNKITGIPKLDDANKAGTNESGKCTLIVTEGDSAKTLAVAGLSVIGRDYYGVFPLRGKCKNVRDASTKQISDNKEFNELKKILGLQQDKVYKNLNELRYGRLMIMTDADVDGSHIKGLILNMFHYFWPSLIGLGFIVSMITPIIKATKGSQTKSFFDETSFRDWYRDGKPGWTIKYYKGLGTSTSKEAREYFGKINELTVKFDKDDETDKSITLAFDKNFSDKRKEWILRSSENKNIEIGYGTITNLGITDFIHKDLINFSLSDLKRSIPHICDGLKPSQRKVLFACLDRNLNKEMKVAQLAAYVSEKTSYHHGENSLSDTIVKLAHDFVGSNNINLLEPCGQFGTRLLGGKDASQPRYIFTKLASMTRKIFDVNDDQILHYLDDDGKSIEPEYYIPIIPMILVNGAEGIGTGFSSFIPPFKPDDIRKNIKRFLNDDVLCKMTPYFEGFTGTITSDGNDTWMATGVYKEKNGTIIIEELPPGRWTQDFKEHLETLIEKRIIIGYTNNSTTDKVNFVINGYTSNDVVRDFKLQKVFHTSNMHMFHPEHGIKKYETPEEILLDFCKIRIGKYISRKNNMIKVMRCKLEKITNMAKFVDMVINEKITIFKRKKTDLENELSKNFIKIDDSFDYLLNIKTYQYTIESVNKLMEERDKMCKDLEMINKLTVNEMWLNDLKICY